MPARQPRIAYVGRESLMEELTPDPSEDAVARERLERENAELRDQVRHLQSALQIAARVLQPYYSRENL
jgi:hypothetical protein